MDCHGLRPCNDEGVIASTPHPVIASEAWRSMQEYQKTWTAASLRSSQ